MIPPLAAAGRTQAMPAGIPTLDLSAAEHEQQLHLRRDAHALLVLLVELVEDLVVVADVLVDGLAPAVEVEVERVEALVQELDGRDDHHEHLARERAARAHVHVVLQDAVLVAHVVEVRLDRVALRRRRPLLAQRVKLEEHLSMLAISSKNNQAYFL